MTIGSRNPEIDRNFHGLAKGVYEIKSQRSNKYNCIAWAAGEDNQKWWPGVGPHAYWPDDISEELDLQSFVSAFSTLGYKKCSDGNLANGVEKLAIFAKASGEPTHAARQLSNGRWTSKLGREEDIEHDLADLEGELYGHVTCFLMRPRRS